MKGTKEDKNKKKRKKFLDSSSKIDLNFLGDRCLLSDLLCVAIVRKIFRGLNFQTWHARFYLGDPKLSSNMKERVQKKIVL